MRKLLVMIYTIAFLISLFALFPTMAATYEHVGFIEAVLAFMVWALCVGVPMKIACSNFKKAKQRLLPEDFTPAVELKDSDMRQYATICIKTSRIAFMDRDKNIAEVKERQALQDDLDNRFMSYQAWVNKQAAEGNRAAQAQLRGWAYHQKRNIRNQAAEAQRREQERQEHIRTTFAAMHTPDHSNQLEEKVKTESVPTSPKKAAKEAKWEMSHSTREALRQCGLLRENDLEASKGISAEKEKPKKIQTAPKDAIKKDEATRDNATKALQEHELVKENDVIMSPQPKPKRKKPKPTSYPSPSMGM